MISRRILAAAILLWAFALPAFAQTGSVKTPSQLNTEINTLYPDNTSNAITPFDLRQAGLDQVASVPFLNSANTFTGSITLPGSGLILSGVTGLTQCLQANSSGVVSGTGAACGSGGGGGGTAFKQDFLSGTDFTPGSTTQLTLTSTPATGQSLLLFQNGVAQLGNWTLSGNIVTFAAPISVGVQVVEAVGVQSSGGGLALTLTTIGSSGAATYNSGTGTLNIPIYTGSGGGTSPGGSNTQVQYNGSGSFAGSSLFTFDGSGINVSLGTTTAKSALVTTLGATGHVAFSGLATTGTIGSALCLDASNNVIKNASSNCFGSSSLNSSVYANAVSTCGADNTGATNTTVAIKNCLSTYGQVGLPSGAYLVTCAQNGTEIVMSTHQSLVGAGAGFAPTQLTCSGTAGNMISLGAQEFLIQGLYLTRTVAPTSGAGIGLASGFTAPGENFVIRDVWAENQWNGYAIFPTDYGVMDNVNASNNYNDGFFFTTNSAGCSQQVNATNIFATANNRYGFEFQAGSTPSGALCRAPIGMWTNVTTFINGVGGVLVQGSTTVAFDDLRMVNVNFSADNGSCITIASGNASNSAGAHNLLLGGLIEGCGTGGPTGMTGRNASSIAPTNAGNCVAVSQFNSELQLHNLNCGSPFNNGISTSGTLSNIIISGNQFSDIGYLSTTAQAAISIGGASTNASVGLNIYQITGPSTLGIFSNSPTTTTLSSNIFVSCSGSSPLTKGAGNIGTGCP